MSFVCNTSFNTFRNKFLRILLEVTVFASILHSCNGSHATVYFVFTSLIQFECSRAFITSGEDASHHADICTGCNGLGNISGIFDTTICNNRNSVTVSYFITIHNSSDLWNTNTSYNTCCTDRSRSDTNLNCINTSINQSLCSSSCCNITCDNLQIRICVFNLTYCSENVL